MKLQLIKKGWSMKGEAEITFASPTNKNELMDFELNEFYEVNIKKWKPKRSLNANAYFHTLANQIAGVNNLGLDEVKKRLNLEYGEFARDDYGELIGVKLPKKVNPDKFYPYCRWVQDKTENNKVFSHYLFMKRTSELDSKEMARLIDGTVEIAKELGIETLTPDELAKLKGYEK